MCKYPGPVSVDARRARELAARRVDTDRIGIVWGTSRADVGRALHEGKEQEVPAITTDGFEAFANSRDIVMIAYGAPWCPWSRRMEPVWKASRFGESVSGSQ